MPNSPSRNSRRLVWLLGYCLVTSACFALSDDVDRPPNTDPDPDPDPLPPPDVPSDPPFPVTVSGKVRSIAVDGGYVYAARRHDLLRISLVDGRTEILRTLPVGAETDDGPDHLLLIDGYLYWKREGINAIERISTLAPDDVEVIITGQMPIASFAVGTQWIFLADGSRGELYRVANEPGGALEQLSETPDGVTQLFPIRLAIDDTAAYVAEPGTLFFDDNGDLVTTSGTIRRVDRSSGDVEHLMDSDVSAGELVAGDSRLYWTTLDGIDTAATDGSGQQAFADVLDPNELVLDDRRLFWIDGEDLYRAELDMGPADMVLPALGTNNLDVIDDAAHIYGTYGVGGDTRIVRVPKLAL